MRIMLHDSYEKKLIELSTCKGITPSQYIKQLILKDYQECTIDAQGGNNGRDKEKEEF